MAFPTTLDSLSRPQPTDTLSNPPLSTVLDSYADSIEALEAKVGVDSSAVSTSHDYKLANLVTADITDITASAAELNILHGATLDVDELNILHGATLDVDELNILDGVTASTAELNITDGGDTTNKVLNKQVKCRAYLSAGQSNVTHASFVKILFNAASYDIGSNFDTTNSRFTAPVTGYYDVKLNVIANSAEANKTYYALIYANGSVYQQGVMSNGSGTLIGVDTNALVYVTAGQYIEGYVYFDSAGDGVDIVSGAINTTLTITLDSI